MAWQPCAAAHATQTSLAAQTTLKAHPLERRRRCVPCRECVWKCPWHIVRTGFAFARQATRTRTTSTWLRLMPLADLDVRHTSGLGADSAYCGVAVSLSLDTDASGGFTFTWVQWTFRQLIMLSTYIHNLFFRLPPCLSMCVCVCAFWPTLLPGIGRHFSPTGWVPVYIHGYTYMYMCVYHFGARPRPMSPVTVAHSHGGRISRCRRSVNQCV